MSRDDALVNDPLENGPLQHGPPIAAVLFDADGVIQRPAPAWRPLLVALCPDPARGEEFLADLFAAERPCLMGTGDFRDALDAVLRRWACAVGVDDALRLWTLIEPDQSALRLVRCLRTAGIRTGLATNQQRQRALYMSEVLDYAAAFDHLFYSCELGHAKPSPGYFAAVLERLDLDAAQVLFIDDHAGNVDAARAAGLSAATFHLDQGVAELARLLSARGLAITDG